MWLRDDCRNHHAKKERGSTDTQIVASTGSRQWLDYNSYTKSMEGVGLGQNGHNGKVANPCRQQRRPQGTFKEGNPPR